MISPKAPALALPEILPVFPLTGVLLFPGTVQLLHIFEPRYRNMVEDTLNTDGVFGMIQPFVPQQDNRPMAGAEKEKPELYALGCAGHVEKWEKAPDGRYMIQLRGINRFRFKEELPLHRGYRRVKAVYDEFPESTLVENWHCDRKALTEALEGYGQAHGLEVQIDQVAHFSDIELVNLLGAALPFHPAEKQALLEAASIKARETVLIDLLRLGAGPFDSGSEVSSRTVN